MRAVIAGSKAIIRRQRGSSVRTRKANRATVTRGSIVELVFGEDGDIKSHAAGAASGGGHCEMIRGSGIHGNARLSTRDAGGRRVGGRQRLRPCRLKGCAE